MKNLTSGEREAVERLYRSMPGAPHVPTEDGQAMWGEVDNTEHWQFCEQIARMISGAVVFR